MHEIKILMNYHIRVCTGFPRLLFHKLLWAPSWYIVCFDEGKLFLCSVQYIRLLVYFLFRIREVPTEYLNIPFQAMECFLTGIKPLGLVTAYFDLRTSKQ